MICLFRISRHFHLSSSAPRFISLPLSRPLIGDSLPPDLMRAPRTNNAMQDIFRDARRAAF